jgi:hypothetical protein
MAVFAVAIKKSVVWRGGGAEFSNVYHYNTNVGQTFEDRVVIDALVAAEKTIYDQGVSFVSARTYGPTDGTQADNVMREVVDLGGKGAAFDSATNYREGAWLIQWPLTRSPVLKRKRFLRKWVHTRYSSLFNADGVSSGATAAPFAALQPLRDYAAVAAEPRIGAGTYNLCTKKGDQFQAPAVVFPFYEHRQFGR